jgi:hypothetical protein
MSIAIHTRGNFFAIGCVIVGSIRQYDLHQTGQLVQFDVS